tara:strand:- start:241 stop:597 length:357 start_codon:yes stop_codon:yes gene_type:complete
MKTKIITKTENQMKNRTINLVKNKDYYLTNDILYNNKYPIVRVQKREIDINKYYYLISVVNASSTELDKFEPFDNYDKKNVALDHAFKIAKNSLIDLMKEVKNIKRNEIKLITKKGDQ